MAGASDASQLHPAVLLGAFGIVLTGLVGYNFIHAPQRRQTGRLQAQLAEQQLKQQTVTELAALFQDLERYRERLPAAPDPSAFTQEIVALAQQAGIQLTSINQQPPETVGPLTTIALNVEFSASYHQLGAFIDTLERSHRFIRVNQFSFAGGDTAMPQATAGHDKEPGEPQVSVRLTCSTFYLPPLLPDGAPSS